MGHDAPGRAARRVRVEGRVQGVYFRDSCRREAVRHGVDGWVRNREDGSVEAWFEGPADAVDAMVQWCWHGPPRALVTGVVATPVAPAGISGFRVR